MSVMTSIKEKNSVTWILISTEYSNKSPFCGYYKIGFLNTYKSEEKGTIIEILHFCPEQFSNDFFVLGEKYSIAYEQRKVEELKNEGILYTFNPNQEHIEVCQKIIRYSSSR